MLKPVYLLLAAILFVSSLRSEENGPADGIDASMLAKVSALIKEWEASPDLTNESAEKLTNTLVALGPGASSSIVACLETASKANSVSTGVLLTSLVRLKARTISPTLVKLVLATRDVNQKRNLLMAIEAFRSPDAIVPLVDLISAALPEELKDPKNKEARDVHNQNQQLILKTLGAMAQEFEGALTLVNAIQNRLVTSNNDMKVQYLQLLQEVPHGWAEELIFSLSIDNSMDVKTAAVFAFGKAGSARKGAEILRMLSLDNIKVKTAVCFALGRIKYLPAIPELIVQLNSKERDVVQAANWALKNISGVQFEASSERWQSWYDGELAESTRRYNELLEQARTGTVELAPLAIEQMAQLALLRNKLVDAMRPFSVHINPRVRAAVCNVLAQSSDDRAPSLLLSLMRDSSAVVSCAAWRGLRYATGKNLPLNPELWTTALKKG